MADTPSRLFSLVAILIAVWVLVYWLYEPRPPRVSADTIPPTPRPVIPPDSVKLPPPPVLTSEQAGGAQPQATQPSQQPEPAAAKPQPPAPPAPQPPAVIEPKFRKYVVQAGDVSWEAIAQRVYGDKKMWKTIAQANPLATSDRLKPGKTVLNIPVDPNNLQGKPNPEYQTSKTSPATEPTAPKTADTTYVVQEGDTLWSIAKKVYGKGGQWEKIYDANRDKIKDKDRPVAGTVLRVPGAE